MSRVISVSNQKGGVGKTTSAVNLAASLAADGRRVLLVDLDPQGNAGSGLGFGRGAVDGSVYHALVGQSPLRALVRTTQVAGLDLVPASADLVGAELELVAVQGREARLRQALAPVRGEYDYLLLDCPPSLGLLTLNALTAADTVLIPLQCEYYAMEGLSALLDTVERVRQSLNRDLSLEGILFTMFDARNNLSHQVVSDVRSFFAGKARVFETVIPRNVRLSEAPSFGKPALLYDLASRGSQSYLALARELDGAQ